MSGLKMDSPCPCGGGKKYATCCGLYLEGDAPAPDAQTLMRSRYTAYVLQREDYLLATWHPSTRPLRLSLTDDTATRWMSLSVKRCEQQDAEHATVEFVAISKVNGRAHRLHEVSRFVHESGKWFYLDGDIS